MKKLIYIVSSICLVVALSGCNKFLDRPSKIAMDDSNYWTSADNVALFVNGVYSNYFAGYSSGWTQTWGVGSRGQEVSDDWSQPAQQSPLLAAVPADNWYRAESQTGYWFAQTCGTAWNFGYVRKWNLLLDRLEMMKENKALTDAEYNHWTGVAKFFRAWEYCRLITSFGDVPYYDHVVATDNFDDQYKARDSRIDIMTKCLEDFEYAVNNVSVDGSGVNTVNKYVVAAVAANCLLYEGTWYTYHANDPAMQKSESIKTVNTTAAQAAKSFLEAAVKYGDIVIGSKKFACDVDFRTMFGAETPVGHEAIIYRYYNTSFIKHCYASYCCPGDGEQTTAPAGNRASIEAWICNDGEAPANSTVEGKDSWRIQDMIKTRDPRFEASFWHEPLAGSNGGLALTKFVDRIGPTYMPQGLDRPAKYASNTNTNGFPCVRYSALLLDWIEAKAELAVNYSGAAVTQADIDASINAIRNRPLDKEAESYGVKKTASLKIASLKDDPERTNAMYTKTLGGTCKTPLLWEIRRERRMELFGECKRTLDIRRWGWLELMDAEVNPKILQGAWFVADEVGENLKANTEKFNKDETQKRYAELKKKAAEGTITPAEQTELDELIALDKAINGTYMLPFQLNKDDFAKNGAPQMSVMKPDGTIVVYNGEADDKGNILSSNKAELVGWKIPYNAKNRDKFSVRNYLMPVCTDIINQYKEKGYTIEQNPGW